MSPITSSHSFRNATSSGSGRQLFHDATARSINTPFIEMAADMDLCAILDTTAAMGIDTQANGTEMMPRPSMVLGTNQNTPLQIAEAFATLAAGGVHCDPVAILEVTDSAGNDVPVPPSNCAEVLAPEVAAEVTTALESVVQPTATGSNAVLEDNRPAAGKTGTANADAAAWFSGYTPQLATAIWMGHIDSNESMFDSTINGQFHPEVYGGLYPAMVFSEYTNRALEGEPVLQFPDATANRPSTSDDDDEPSVAVPDVVGYSVDDATTLLERAGFEVSVGAERSSEWRAGGVAAGWRTGDGVG